MTKRTDILNYLAHVLRHVKSNNNANAIAVLNQGVVDSAVVDIAGLFYRGASVSLESPGIVRANAIAILDGDSVGSVIVDVPGGVYDGFVELLTSLGFTLQTQSEDVIGVEQSAIPSVRFTGGEGSGANGYAIVNSAGSVTSVVIDAPGSGYTTPPEIIIDLPASEIAPATARAHCVRGRVTSIDVTSGSHSYLFTPNVHISSSSLRFSTSVSQVRRSYAFLEDINDFPTLCFDGTPTENYTHYGAGQQLRKMQQLLRGYTHTHEENSIASSEALARDVEAAVNEFAYLAANLDVYYSRVTSIATDEGLYSPYGICDINVEIGYEA